MAETPVSNTPTDDRPGGLSDTPIVLPRHTAQETDVPADDGVDVAQQVAVEEVGGRLEELDRLGALLTTDESYVVPPLDYQPPPDFKLSVVIPVYNEERTIHEILARVRALPLQLQIIVVDDCSTDDTRRLLAQVEALPELSVIYKNRNQGKGAALRTGFAHADGNVVIVQDADLEYDPRDIPRLIEPIVDGEADVVYGSRFLEDNGQDPSYVHRLGNGLLTWASNLLTGQRLTDMETCYKAFHRNVLRGLAIQQNRFGFEPEVTAKLARHGYRIRELPISYQSRGWSEGKKIGVKDALSALWCIVRYSCGD